MEDLIISILKWAAIIGGSAISGIGINKLLENKQKRTYEVEDRAQDRKDKRDDVREANNEHQLEADGNVLALVLKRLDKVEADNEKLRDEAAEAHKEFQRQISNLKDEAASQREMIIKKDAKIEHLEEENKRLTTRCETQDDTIAALRRELDALKKIVTANGLKFEMQNDDPLKVEIVKGKEKNM